MDSELVLSWPLWAAAGAVFLAAGFTQGALGFGFPTISTPVLVLLTDVKTAIILNLLPNFTVNTISIVRGGNWGASLGRYWPVAVYVLIGSFLGAMFLIMAPPAPLRLLLALIIIAYLYQHRLAKLDWSWLARRPYISALGFGLTGGFFSGSLNQSLPPLLIYFTLLGLEITAMTQILNLCFLGGKAVQAATLGLAGQIALSAVLANIPMTLIALAGMYLGTHAQRRFSVETYNRVLRRILFAIALVLIWQASASVLR
ncbi:MAG: sulfite exporter TauE/SafE family protein [Betaproteobacteria bacterium]|nr:sulfite exporter TauE/SafE family protein [Betaproteobacteria bacterium]